MSKKLRKMSKLLRRLIKKKIVGKFQPGPNPSTPPPRLEKKNKNFSALKDSWSLSRNKKFFHLK